MAEILFSFDLCVQCSNYMDARVCRPPHLFSLPHRVHAVAENLGIQRVPTIIFCNSINVCACVCVCVCVRARAQRTSQPDQFKTITATEFKFDVHISRDSPDMTPRLIGGETLSALDLRSSGRGFDSRSGRYQAT